MKKIPLLIDTDIGDDADDALAIALAVESQEFDLIGITTVFKNTLARAALATQELEVFSRADIPVFAGVGMPMVERVDTTEIPCQCGENVAFEGSRDAVSFLLRSLRTVKDLQIAAMGPLTNLAVAALIDPEAMKNANIVLMGGAYGNTEAEWNILCDPEAARIVFESGANIRAIGLDVTTKCVLTDAHQARIQRHPSPKAQFLWRLIRAWKERTGYGVTLHDPLVVVSFLCPALIHFEEQCIEIELRGEITRGVTLVKRSFFPSKTAIPNAQVATQVNSGEVISLFMQRVFEQNGN